MKLLLKEPKPIIYLSGNNPHVAKEMDKRKITTPFKCFSFCMTCKGAFSYSSSTSKMLAECIKRGEHIMMDSSAYTFHQWAKKKLQRDKVDQFYKETVRQYIKYCQKEGDDWDFYVNFDYVKHCPTIFKMQEKLEKKGLEPVPVYHGDQSLDWFKRYCDRGNKLICVGIAGRHSYEAKLRYYSTVFNEAEKRGVALHALGMTAPALMFRLPWYSVDSATWILAAAYGLIVLPMVHRGILMNLSVSGRRAKVEGNGLVSYQAMPKTARREVKEYVEECGFNMKELQKEHAVRASFNAWIFRNRLDEIKELTKQKVTKWKSLL